MGLNPKTLADLDADIAAGKYGYVDSMLVIRHGNIVYDRSYKHDYDRIYGGDAAKPGPLNPHDPSGPYNYYQSLVASFLSARRLAHDAVGDNDCHISGATQLLSHIFRRATGKDIEEYAQQHLFAPLGIERYYWKRSPSGLADTEGGLYLRPHDLAKIAYLFLKNGVWDGKVIVEPEWVKASLTPSVSTASRGDGVKYGFKWWLYPYGKDGTHLAWGGAGFGGQRPIVLPNYDLVIVFTGWNILPDRPSLTPQAAIERILEAVIDQRGTSKR